MGIDRTLLLSLATLATTPLQAQADCPPHIPGEPLFWIVSLCQLRAETDDYESPSVQDCIGKTPSAHRSVKSPTLTCKLNARYKREWCSQLVKNGVETSVEKCFNSREAIPTIVRNGHVGN